MFATKDCLQLMCKSKIWFMDGNYKMAPKHFLQLYILRVPLGSTAVSVMCILLQRKNQATYEEMFQTLLEKCHEQNLYPDPEEVMIDFEIPVIKAVKNILGIDARGCFYHKRQCTWRKIQDLGLVTHHRENEEFCYLIYCLH